jgi:serine/threonine-protein kinase
VATLIRLALFGAPQISRADGTDASALLAQPKRLALLAYLAIGADTYHRRDSLLAVFWPELDQFAARRALRNTLYQLRLALDDDVFASRGDDEIKLDGAKLWCDVVALRDAVAANRYDEAAGLYRGELLDGFHVSNAGETFEDWLIRERARARELALRALGAVADAATREGRHADAARAALRAGELAPFDEGWLQKAALALDAAGDRSAALRLYETFAQRLKAELDAEPSAEARALFERLRAGSAAPVDVTPAEAPPPAATALPRPSGRRWWPMAGAAGVVALAMLGVLARAPSASAHPHPRLIVSVFENRTGDPRLDPVGDMVVDWITRSILETKLIEVVDPRVLFTRIHASAGQPIEPIALARRNGASTLITGSYYRSGDSLLFIASVIDVASTRVLRSVGPLAASLTRPADGVEATRSRVLASVASILDPHFAAEWNASVAPPPFEAYSPYIAGDQQFWLGDAARAESLFAVSMARDSTFDGSTIGFATAAARLSDCVAVDSIAALPRLHRHVLEPVDGFTLRIAVAHCHGRNDELLRLVIERGRALPPSSPMQVSTAGAALWANRPTLAIEALRRMNPQTDLDWLPTADHIDYWQDLCEAYHLVGQHDSELVAANRQISHETLDQNFNRVRALAGLRRSAEVLRELDASFALPPEPSLGSGLGPNTYGRTELTGTPAWIGTYGSRELMVHGDTSAAREAAASTIAWIDAQPAATRNSQELRTFKVWLNELRGTLVPALALVHTLVAEDTGNVDFRGTLGGLAAASGDTGTARAADAWLASLPAERGSWGSSFYRARIAVLLGRPDDGAALVRESRDRGAWPYFLHTDPVLHRLTALPR